MGVVCCWIWEGRVSAEAEKIKELVRSTKARSALPPKMESTFKFGSPVRPVRCYCLLFSVLRESVLSYDSSPGSRSLIKVSRGWGLASLMRCAEKILLAKTKKRAFRSLFQSRKLAHDFVISPVGKGYICEINCKHPEKTWILGGFSRSEGQKILDNLPAFGMVVIEELRMELDAVNAPALLLHSLNFARLVGGREAKTIGQLFDLVAV